MYDITIYQGRTFEQVFLVREADQSTPVVLTGYSAGAELRNRPGGTLLLSFEAIVEPASGKVIMRASAEATDLLSKGGVYDLALYRDDGATPLVLAFAQGKAVLDKQVVDIE